MYKRQFNHGLDLAEDGQGQEGYTGNDTTGLFLADGTIKSVEPPGDTSYILGPMMSMWYAWANYTQIGYVRQSDRKMVNLGRITGEMSDWDGATGFIHQVAHDNYLEKHEAICIKRICPHCKTYRSNRKNVLARHIQQCKLASEQKPDVVSEIKEILPVHHDEPSQLQPVHLSDDDVSQTHLDQSVHNT